MKKEDIFQAVGELDSAFLSQCEVPQSKGRKFWLILPIAALIAALGITVGAGGFGRISQGDATEVTVTSSYFNGAFHEEYESDKLEVFVDLEANSNAPTSLQTIFLPKICEEWEVSGISRGYGTTIYGTDLTMFRISWNHPDRQYKNNIEFEQLPLRIWQANDQTDTVTNYLSGTHLDTKMLRWNEKEAFLVTAGPTGNELTQFHQLYWTDGDYVFILRCPYGIGEDWMKAAMDSLAPAENLDKMEAKLSQTLEEGQAKHWEALLQAANSSPKAFTKRFRPASGRLEIQEGGGLKLRLDEAAAPDAPEKVEMIIFPAMALEKDYNYHTNFVPTYVVAPEGVRKGVTDYFAVNWPYEDGGMVEYWQIAHNSSYADLTRAVGGFAGDIEVAQVTIGNYTLLQITGKDVLDEDVMGKGLYWMDEDYRYILTCPLAMTDSEILEFLDSLDRLQ